MEEKITINNKSNEKLVGVKTIPRRSDGKVALFVHGFGYFKEEGGMFVALADKFSELGITSYRFDFTGCGESEGDFSKSTLTSHIEDLKLILKYVKEDSGIKESELIIMGQSFGTSVIIALHPKAKKIILMGTAAYPKELLAKRFWEGYNPKGISSRTRTDGSITSIGPQFWKDLKNYNLPELIKKITCPLLFVHGSIDTIVPVNEMEEMFANANEPKEKVILEGSDHSIRPNREQMYKVIADWVNKT